MAIFHRGGEDRFDTCADRFVCVSMVVLNNPPQSLPTTGPRIQIFRIHLERAERVET